MRERVQIYFVTECMQNVAHAYFHYDKYMCRQSIRRADLEAFQTYTLFFLSR